LNKINNDLKNAEQFRITNVAAGVRIKGEISGNEDLLVDGSIEGPVHLGDGQLTIGASGKLVGDIEAREVIVLGSVRGNVKARDRVEIKTEGSIVGDVATARIIIEDGAQFKGSIEIENKAAETVNTTAPLLQEAAAAATTTSSKKK